MPRPYVGYPYLATGGTVARSSPDRWADLLTARDFGVTGDGVTDDTDALLAAMAAAVLHERPLRLSGTIMVRPAETLSWTTQAGYPMRITFPLASGLHIIGENCTIKFMPPAWTPATDTRIGIFGTALNMTAGTLKNITFEGITFDFTDQFWSPAHIVYAFVVVGVDHFVRRNCNFVYTGSGALSISYRGRGIEAQNCRWRVDENLHHDGITQAYYIFYEQGWTGRGLSFRSLVEAIDIDAVAYDVDLSQLHFEDFVGSEQQCIDLANTVRVNISDVTVKNAHTVVYVYDKIDSWLTFADFYAHFGEADWIDRTDPTVADVVLSESISVTNVRGQMRGGSAELVAIIGLRRENPAWGNLRPVRDVTFRDWDITGGSSVQVFEGTGLNLDGLRLRNFTPGTGAEFSAALVLAQTDAGEPMTTSAAVSGIVQNIEITNSAGMGMILHGFTGAVGNIRIDGWNTQQHANTACGLKLNWLLLGKGRAVTLSGQIDISGGPATPVGHDLRVIGLGPGPATTFDCTGASIRCASSAMTKMAFGGVLVPTYPRRDVILPVSIVVPASPGSIVVPIMGMGERSATIANVVLQNYAAITGDAANHATVFVRRNRAGVLGVMNGGGVLYGNAALAVGAVTSLAVAPADADAELTAGDMLVLQFSGVGTGQTFANLIAIVSFVPYRVT